MSEYNIQMNKYNALNAEYDQLYPQPMKHANTHAKDGSDPITPADIGAYTKTETDTLLANKVAYVGPFVDNGNFNDYTTPGSYVIGGSSITNGPTAQGYYYLDVQVFSTEVLQLAKSIWTGLIHFRRYTDGVGWTNWNSFATAADLATKVSKSGDTMTGNLNITNSNPYFELVETDSQEEYIIQVHKGDFYIGSQSHGSVNGLVLKPDGTILAKALYSVLHTGNAQSLGFPKIATGSYVGTGVAGQGQSTATVLTFNFAPKFLILVQDEGALPDGTTLLSRVGAYSIYGYSGFYHFYTYSSGFACKLLGWGTNTLSYYTNGADATYQFNASGKTYYYMALG